MKRINREIIMIVFLRIQILKILLLILNINVNFFLELGTEFNVISLKRDFCIISDKEIDAAYVSKDNINRMVGSIIISKIQVYKRRIFYVWFRENIK